MRVSPRRCSAIPLDALEDHEEGAQQQREPQRGAGHAGGRGGRRGWRRDQETPAGQQRRRVHRRLLHREPRLIGRRPRSTIADERTIMKALIRPAKSMISHEHEDQHAEHGVGRGSERAPRLAIGTRQLAAVWPPLGSPRGTSDG